MVEPKFKIGDRVFHILPESRVGVVIEIKYVFSIKIYEYQVVFDENTASLFYYEHELTDKKLF